MSWGDDLATLASIRDRLAASERLAPEEVAALASQAEAVVRTARAALRRSEAAVAHLEDSLKPSLSADAGQDGDHATGPEA
jgi:hypothetical protein